MNEDDLMERGELSSVESPPETKEATNTEPRTSQSLTHPIGFTFGTT